ncbi:hypothetical protein PGQ11_015655 [Apiospora arundinis]|uniref:Uncharacterized protein n=1 Tax=Apiospora arundinis TaxID=335852 RepID=A0ABR2HM01_9PEZI
MHLTHLNMRPHLYHGPLSPRRQGGEMGTILGVAF